jgi:hypothetical protein
MNNLKKDWKIYLSSFLLIVFFAGLPMLISRFILVPFSVSVDFMDLVFYYLVFFVSFFVSLVLFFFGLGKKRLKGGKTFLIYYSLLFLATLYAVAYWLGWLLDFLFRSPFRFL